MSRRAFENLQYRHVCALLDIVEMVRSERASHIRKLFSENAEGFDEVVSFLSRLRVISSKDEKLRSLVDWPASDGDYRRAEIMRRILSTRNRYRTELLRFMSQFRLVNSDISYFPSDQSRSSQSAVRNFLIDLRMVKYFSETKTYLLMPEYVSLFVSARDNASQISPTLAENRAEAQQEIGRAAEELILKYERKRVGCSYADKIDHVSLRNCAAGYDIRSLSITTSGRITPRFIEVKAVSPRSFRFYWTKNEVKVARALSHWYHLYLLPVNRKGQFEVDELLVIPDPCSTVLSEGEGWATESDALVCYIKAPTTR